MNEKVSISYQLAAEGGGGIISSRDFINLRYCEVRDGVYICAGKQFHPSELSLQNYFKYTVTVNIRNFHRLP